MRFKLEGDEVVSLEVIRERLYDEVEADDDEENVDVPETDEEGVEEIYGVGPEVLVVTDGGMGKRSFVANYRKTNRGAKGVVSIRMRENESVISVLQITDSDEVLLSTERGQLSRIPAGEIRRIGRVGRGVKIMNLNDGDRITGVAKLIEVASAKSDAAVEEMTPAGETPAVETSENNTSPESGNADE